MACAFETLRPLCVRLARHPDRESVASLRSAVDVVDTASLDKLSEYLLWPLRLLLKQADKSSELRISAIRCIERILRESTISRPETFQDLFNSLCFTLSSPANQGKVTSGCEELKLAVVDCLMMLLQSADDETMQSFYTASFLPVIGHAVALLLHLVEDEGMRELRVRAMQCLSRLALCDRRGASPVSPAFVGGMFASFLPGISIALCRVITADCKQGQRVTVCGLDVWADLVTLVLGDDLLPRSDDDAANQLSVGGKQTAGCHGDGGGHDSLAVARLGAWQRETAGKLDVLVKRIAALVGHANWRVRQALVGWADGLLTRCARSLEVSTSSLLEVLVSLVGDRYAAVSGTARGALSRLRASRSPESPLITALQENVHSLAESLPRLVRSADDSQKLVTLKLTAGYISLIGGGINRMISSYSHLQRLSLSLLQTLELDCSHIQILQQQAPCEPISGLADGCVLQSRFCFKHFRDDAILAEVKTICRLLGYYGDLQLLVDHFMDHFHQSSLHRKQAIIIISEILLGTTGKGIAIEDVSDSCHSDPSTIEAIISDLLTEFLSTDNWTLPVCGQSDRSAVGRSDRSSPVNWLDVTQSVAVLSPSSSSSSSSPLSSSVEKLNGNILQLCLLLEAVGAFAEILGEKFRWYLMSALYPVLEKLGATNGRVSGAAYTCLLRISGATNYRSIAELLSSNCDYLLNDISLRLRHSHEHARATSVLKVILEYGDTEAISLVDDIVQDILLALDSQYEEEAAHFLLVLRSLVAAILKWHKPDPDAQQSEAGGPGSRRAARVAPKTGDDVRDFFLELCAQHTVAAGGATEEEEDGCGGGVPEAGTGGEEGEEVEAEAEAMVEDRKPEPPKHIKLVMQVMERCRHLLAAGSTTLHMMVLDTIGQSCEALRYHTDELLPLVHKVWPALLTCFNSADRRITIKTFDVLVAAANASGDFIRQRVVKNIFSEIVRFLQSESSISRKDATPFSRHGINNKLQRHLLAGIASLCEKLDVNATDVKPVIDVLTLYLSERQPLHLQQACVESFRQFLRLHPDLAWTSLRGAYNPSPLHRPHSSLENIKLAGGLERNEFTQNVTSLLRELDALDG